MKSISTQTVAIAATAAVTVMTAASSAHAAATATISGGLRSPARGIVLPMRSKGDGVR